MIPPTVFGVIVQVPPAFSNLATAVPVVIEDDPTCSKNDGEVFPIPRREELASQNN